MIKVSISLRVRSPNELNAMHWSKRHKNTKVQKQLTRFHLNNVMAKSEGLPCTVKLTRYGPRKLDYDNLLGAFKAIRDEVADYLIPGLAPGQADGDERITWQYEQESAKSHGYEIEIVGLSDVG